MKVYLPLSQGSNKSLTTFLEDAYEIMIRYKGGISHCAHEIYYSMLHLESGYSLVADHYQNSASSNVRMEVLGSKPFEGYSYYVSSVGFSPDGAFIVIGTSKNMLYVLNVVNGKLVSGPFEGHTGRIHSVSFSPDGTRVASGSGDETVRIWDVETGELVTGVLEGHHDRVYSVKFSPDGTLICSGSKDMTLRIYEVASGWLVGGPLVGHTDSVESVGFSPDGKRIVSGSSDKTIVIWDWETGRVVVGPLVGHTESVRSVEFSPCGTRVVSLSRDGTIRIWDAINGELNVRPLKEDTGTIFSVRYLPGGTGTGARTLIMSLSDSSAIKIWDAESGELVDCPFHGDSVIAARFSNGYIRLVASRIFNPLCIRNVKYDPTTTITTRNQERDGYFRNSSDQPKSEGFVGEDDHDDRSDTGSYNEIPWKLREDGWTESIYDEVLMWVPDDLRRYIVSPAMEMEMWSERGVGIKLGGSRTYIIKPHFYPTKKLDSFDRFF